MTDSLITSPQNSRIKAVRKLHRRKYREQTRSLLLEGVRLVDDAWQAGVRPRLVLYAPAAVGNNLAAQRLLDTLQQARIETLACTPEVFATLTDTVTPQGIAAAVPMPELPWPAAPSLLLLLDGVRDPGNAGTLLRSAAAAGVAGVIIGPAAVDPFNDKVVRAAMGAHFRLPLRTCATWDTIHSLLPPAITCYVAEAGAALAYDVVDWRTPAVLIVGGEADGPSAAARALATPVAIPMADRIESLNAGVAGSVILFEAARQRRRSGSTADDAD